MTTFPAQFAGLLRADAYPHAIDSVRVIETHISWVLLTGPYAYKIKRPVRYPFVDFRTLAARERFCYEELRLNRRFAPHLYVDVLPIVSRDGAAALHGAGAVIDYAVKMRQFDPRQELSQLVALGEATAAELAVLGVDVAGIHAGLPVVRRDDEVEHARSMLQENAQQCVAAAGSATQRADIEMCAAALASATARLSGVLAERARHGRVRECHGDLHMSNVARVDGRLLAFDCLEFEPAFSQIDVAQEVAFLTMDLSVHDRRDLATAFLNAWLAASGDFAMLEVLDMFEAHCALVRAKVCGLNVSHCGADEARALRSRQERCVAYAKGRLAPRATTLTVMHGMSGSGKSWLAERMGTALGAVVIRSDVERKRMGGLSLSERSNSPVGAGLYTASRSNEVYASLARHAEAAMRGGRDVIVDAAFLRRADRERFACVARQRGVRPVLLVCEAPATVLERRVAQREREARDVSEAGRTVLDWQRTTVEPANESEGFDIVRVDTSAADAVSRALVDYAAARGAHVAATQSLASTPNTSGRLPAR